MSTVVKAIGPRLAQAIFKGSAPTTALKISDGSDDLEVGSVWRCRRTADARYEPLEFLAAKGSAKAELWELAYRFGTSPDYPDAVIDEARRREKSPGFDAPSLVDHRSLAFVTIDNEDSRDLDQAMFIRRSDPTRNEPEQGFVVFYALADASFYVPRDGALFAEALKRGASYYFPGLAIPMLPPSLSEGLVSLNPRVDRRALIFEMWLDATGMPAQTHVYLGLIHSHAKLSYDGVQSFFDAPDGHALSGKAYTETLELLRRVGILRIEDAERRNVVRYNRIGMSVGFTDEKGAKFTAFAESRNDCEKYNEQISLLCNIEGARILLRHTSSPDLQPIFRVHPAPTEERLTELHQLIDAIVRVQDLPRTPWCWKRREESLAEYLRRLPRDGEQLRVARAIERAALVTNLRSTFDPSPGAHYGVGAEIYARMSSPMREVVGIFSHYELLEVLRAKSQSRPPAEKTGAELALRDAVVRTANESKLRQKRITNACNQKVLDHVFSSDIKQPFRDRPVRSGIILGMRNDRLYVQLDTPPMEVKVFTTDLAQVTDDEPSWSRDKASMLAKVDGVPLRWCIGDVIRLRVWGYQDRKRRWMLAPVV